MHSGKSNKNTIKNSAEQSIHALFKPKTKAPIDFEEKYQTTGPDFTNDFNENRQGELSLSTPKQTTMVVYYNGKLPDIIIRKYSSTFSMQDYFKLVSRHPQHISLSNAFKAGDVQIAGALLEYNTDPNAPFQLYASHDYEDFDVGQGGVYHLTWTDTVLSTPIKGYRFTNHQGSNFSSCMPSHAMSTLLLKYGADVKFGKKSHCSYTAGDLVNYYGLHYTLAVSVSKTPQVLGLAIYSTLPTALNSIIASYLLNTTYDDYTQVQTRCEFAKTKAGILTALEKHTGIFSFSGEAKKAKAILPICAAAQTQEDLLTPLVTHGFYGILDAATTQSVKANKPQVQRNTITIEVKQDQETEKFTRGMLAEELSNYETTSYFFKGLRSKSIRKLFTLSLGNTSDVISYQDIENALKHSSHRLSLFQNKSKANNTSTDKIIVNIRQKLTKN